MKTTIGVVFSLLILALVGWGILEFFGAIIGFFSSINPALGTGIITASATILVSTFTVVVGRYLERQKDIEAHFRSKKIEIYDEFLKEFYKVFAEEGARSTEDVDLVNFLKEWQRRIILWGGQDVVNAYVNWAENLKTGNPSARTMFLTEDFFRALRKDIGQKNWKLTKGTFVKLLLRHPDIFLREAAKNPNVTLAALSEIEAKLSLK